jgi:hypothetical protein
MLFLPKVLDYLPDQIGLQDVAGVWLVQADNNIASVTFFNKFPPRAAARIFDVAESHAVDVRAT